MRTIDRRSLIRAGLIAGLAGPNAARAQPAGVSAEQRLHDLNLVLPRFATPQGGNNPPFVRVGNLLFLAGLGPRNPDGSYVTGKLGKDITVEQGYQRARLAGLRALAVMQDALGSLDNVARVVKLLGMVNATPDFTDLGRVINGCSDLFVQVFGAAKGRHARTLMGVASLPFNISVEIDLIVEAV